MISKYQQTKQLIDALSDDEIKALFKQYESITAILQMPFRCKCKGS